MKKKKFIVLIVLVFFAFFVSTCSAPGEDQSKDQGVSQTDETSMDIGNVNYDRLPSVSAEYFWKINKAGSNLSWAACARMAIISMRYYYDPWIKDNAWQGDMSLKYYNDRNAKPYDYWNMIDVVQQALDDNGDTIPRLHKLSPGSYEGSKFYQVLKAYVPIIILRRDKNNFDNFWCVIIYAMPNTTPDQETISVWDPHHGWSYTCDLQGFVDDDRFYYDGYWGQYAIWPGYGAYYATTPGGNIKPYN